MAKEVKGLYSVIEGVDKVTPVLDKINDNTKKTAKSMDASLEIVEKAFKRLATNTDKTMKQMTNNMRSLVTETEGLNKRMLDRLLKMQQSNAAAIKAQTKSITEAITGMGKVSDNSVAQMDKVGAKLKSHERYYDTLIGKFRSLAVNVWIASQALQSVGSTLAGIFKPGFDFTQQMETTTIGTAGILSSMFNLDGKTLEWNKALSMSKGLMKDIASDALATTATVQELTQIFQSILAPASSAGWSIEQTREFTKVGANAVKAIGLPSQQVVQELRDLIMGGIRPASSTLAASLGINDATVKQWKESGKLFENLMLRMQGFNKAAKDTQESFAGLFSNIQDGIQQLSASAFTPFFAQIKDGLKWVQGLFFEIKQVEVEVNGKKVLKDFAEFNPQTKEFFEAIGSMAKTTVSFLQEMFNKFSAFGGIISSIYQNIDGITNAMKIFALVAGVAFAPFSTFLIVVAKVLYDLDLINPILKFIAKNIELVTFAFVAWKLGATALVPIVKIIQAELAVMGATGVTALGGVKSGFIQAGIAARAFGVAVKSMLISTVIGAVIVALGYLTQKLWEFQRRFSTEQDAKIGDVNEKGEVLVGREPTGTKIWGKEQMKGVWVPPTVEQTPNLITPADYEIDKAKEDAKRLTQKFPTGDDGKVDKAANRAGIAKLKADLAEYLATLKTFQKELDYRKQENEISIQEYWQSTLKLTQDGLKEEIRVLEQEKAFANDEAALYNMEKDIKKKTQELATAEVDVKRKLAKDLKAFNKEILGIEKEYLSVFGNVSQEALNRIAKLSAEDKFADITKKITQDLAFVKSSGGGTEEAKKRIVELENVLKQIALLTGKSENVFKSDTYLANFNREASIYSAKITEINDKEKRGILTSIEADSQRAKIYSQSSDALQQEINKMQELYDKTKDPSLLINLESAKQKMWELKDATQQTAITMGTTFANSIASAFGDLITGTKSAADAFKSMANAIISELIRVMVVQRMVASIMKAFGFAGGRSVGYSSATVLARPTSGNMAPGTNASGGPIFGAGTSTSDSIPAMLSDGEFVIKAASVKSIGLEKLAYMNSFGRLPKFAVGGSVGNKGNNNGSLSGIDNIKIELKNNTGQQMQVQQPQVSFDGTTMVISAFIDGVAKNTLGVRDLITSRK